MKKFYFLFLIVIAFLSFQAKAQNLPVDPSTKKVVYTGVVEVAETSKNELYSRANEWFAKTYHSAQNVLQMQDKESGKLIGKALFTPSVKSMGAVYDAGKVNYTIYVFVKDNKFKYEITDFYHDKGASKLGSGGAIENEKPACGGMQMVAKQWQYIKAQTDDYTKVVISSLTSAMQEKTVAKDDF